MSPREIAAQTAHGKPTRRAIRIVAAVVVPAGLFLLLLSQVELGQVWQSLRSAELAYLAGGLVVFASLDFWRAVRYRVFVPLRLNLLVPIAGVHSLANTVLPLRLGEFSFPYLLRRSRVAVYDSVSALIVVRILDLVVLCCGVLIAGLMVASDVNAGLMTGLAALIGAMTVGAAVLLLTAARTGRGRRLWSSVARPLAARLPCSWRETGTRLIDGLGRSTGRSQIVRSTVLSVMLWSANSMTSLLLLRAVGIQLSVAQAVFAVSVLQFFTLLPISSLGGLGVTDVSWVGLLVVYGVSFDQASAAVIATRILFYVYVVVWGCTAWIWWRLVRGRADISDANPKALLTGSHIE